MNTRSEFKCRAENITAGETRLQNLNDRDEGLSIICLLLHVYVYIYICNGLEKNSCHTQSCVYCSASKHLNFKRIFWAF
jgi:hypothetical protein